MSYGLDIIGSGRMQYSELESLIANYNSLVKKINSIMDNELAQHDIENAPYEEFELAKATDNNESHAPYLYMRFVHLPYIKES